jgi:hypothetical protein
MRKDGRFIGADGSIPEGQGIIMANLNECHELVEMVRHPPCFSPSTYAAFIPYHPIYGDLNLNTRYSLAICS